MFKILDRYIIRKFLGTYVFSIVMLLAIVVVFDINEKLDGFQKATMHEIIFDYFLNFLPYFADQFAPLFTFIAVIFFTSKLAGNSEIIAMLSAGVSFNRLLRPYMVSAAIIALASLVLSNYVIPPANVKRIKFTETYINPNKVNNNGSNIMLMVNPGEIAYMSSYDRISNRGTKFALEKFNDQKQLISRVKANIVKYDEEQKKWRLENFEQRDFVGTREIIQTAPYKDTTIGFEPSDFLISAWDQEKLTTPQLVDYIDKQTKRGVANIQAFEVEYHRRYAMTAAAFILTVIGMTLSSKKTKGGMGLNIGIGLVLSFSYILFMAITKSFAISGLTSPMIAMWIPNIIFTIIAIVLYKKAL